MTTQRANAYLRWTGFAGLASALLIFAGQLLSTWETPAPSAGAATWSRWAIEHEGRAEIGTYYLAVPGLLLFLIMAAALAELQPAGISRRLTGWGSMIFVALMAVAGVLSTTTSSAHGFFDRFEDDRAVTVLTGLSAGFHLMIIAEWGIALTMAAVGLGLAAAGRLSPRLRTLSWAWAAVTAATGALGFGLLPVLIWTVAASALLIRIRVRDGDPEPNVASADESLIR
jgi:hypothetical protein